MPLGNQKDVELLPSGIKQKLDIQLVTKVEEVLNDAIIEKTRRREESV